jgi:hypothetical protein
MGGAQRMTGEGFVANDIAIRSRKMDEIRAGLAGTPDDRWFWLDKVCARRDALAADKPIFGLLPHEEAELVELNALLDANT